MTALRKTLVLEEAPVAATARGPAKLYVLPIKAAVAAPEVTGSIAKNVALFLAAPFIGLAYIIAFPFVGLGVLAVLTVRAATKFSAVRTLAVVCKHIAMLIAAPFIGLAYVVFFPVICLAALAWTGGRAALGTSMR
jgi:hypothetical protein